MKIIISTLLMLSLFTECKSQESNVQLKGGYDSLYKAIKHKTILPNLCGQSGRVFVDFVITELGDTKRASIAKGLCPTADSIALDIVKNLKYIPAKRNGISVAIKQSLPIYFTKEE